MWFRALGPSTVRPSLVLPLLMLLCASVVRAEVLVVGPGGGFRDVQGAVDAATDGDLVLIRGGDYGPVTLGDVSLTLAADRDARVRLHGGLTVRGLSAGRQVVLSDLVVLMDGDGPAPAKAAAPRPALVLSDCAGSLRVQDCELRPDGGSLAAPQAGVAISDCADVSLARTTVRALDGPVRFARPTSGAEPPPAVHVRTARVLLADVDLRGHDAGALDGGDPLPGGAALVVDGGLVQLGGGRLQGGRGSPGVADCPGGDGGAPGGPGGPALRLTSGRAKVLVRGAELGGGDGGPGAVARAGGCSGTPDGADGAPVERLAGTLLPVDGAPTALDLASPLTPGEPLRLGWTGSPGALVGVLWSPDPDWRLLVGLEGPLTIDLRQPSFLRVAGRLAPAGTRQLSLALPLLPPGWDHLDVHFQVLTLGSQGLEVGAPASLVVLGGKP